MGESETVGMSEQILHTIVGPERQAGGSTKAVQSLVMLSYSLSRSILLLFDQLNKGGWCQQDLWAIFCRQ